MKRVIRNIILNTVFAISYFLGTLSLCLFLVTFAMLFVLHRTDCEYVILMTASSLTTVSLIVAVVSVFQMKYFPLDGTRLDEKLLQALGK